MGSIALIAFAVCVWLFLPHHKTLVVLAGSTLVWLTVSVLIWRMTEAI